MSETIAAEQDRRDPRKAPVSPAAIGVVVIGRNEGERLGVCLRSVLAHAGHATYVDSGSTDGSVALARSLGADVVELDLSIPFTAGRARNEGFSALKGKDPSLLYVQFVDGDCEMTPGWLETAARFLEAHPDVAAVCGRLTERHPERSVYNRLCDIEWDGEAGETRYCGGIAMFRASAFEEIGGFRPDVIAGEEPELCVRLRDKGWTIWRLADAMALHDAAMTRFGQWWKRMVRGGYAYAQGAAMHGRGPSRHWVKERRSILFWSLVPPLAALAAMGVAGPWGLLVLLVYPLQVLRLALRSHLAAGKGKWAYPVFLMIGKFPQLQGVLRYYAERKRGRAAIIEYK